VWKIPLHGFLPASLSLIISIREIVNLHHNNDIGFVKGLNPDVKKTLMKEQKHA
jgi:hypothetical protein